MVKQQSLAELASGKVLDAPVEDFGPLQVVASRQIGPYVAFAQPKASEQWTALATKLPGLQDGDPVLIHPDPQLPERLQPMRFTMLACKQFWVKRDKSAGGQQVGVPSIEQKSRAEGWCEEVFSACLVYVQRSQEIVCVPATCMFKTVKCPAAVALKLQIEAAASPEWAEQSQAHKMAFQAFAKPFLRVVASVQMSQRKGSTGYSYVQARAICSPATPTEYQSFARFMADGGLEKLKALNEHYRGRLAEMGVPA